MIQMHYSKRNQLLSHFGEVEMPTIAVELYEKWYSLWLLKPDSTVEAIMFPDYDFPSSEISSPSACDHVPNPDHVEQLCLDKGYQIGDFTKELLVGRWETEFKENYFKKI